MTGDLKTPGELLQEARRARGLSISDLSAKTKIPDRILQAIELDDYQKVSGTLYVKSFLRTYAEYVGLDPQEILDLYQRQPGVVDEARGARATTTPGGHFAPQVPSQPATPQTIGKPPVDEEAVGGDVWKEDVQIRRVGLSGRSRLLLWLGLVAIIVIIVFLVSKGIRRGGEGDRRQPGSAATSAVSDQPSDTAVDSTARSGSGSEIVDQPATEPATPPQALPTVAEDTRGPESEPVVEQKTPENRLGLPSALRGDSTLVFAGGRQARQVVRIVCAEPLAVEVRWFGMRQPLTAVWTLDPAPLPARGIEPGRGYRVGEGLVLYWGSDYDIEIKLPSISGISVSLNGEPVSLDEAAVGRWRLLNPNVVGR